MKLTTEGRKKVERMGLEFFDYGHSNIHLELSDFEDFGDCVMLTKEDAKIALEAVSKFAFVTDNSAINQDLNAPFIHLTSKLLKALGE